MGAFGRIEDDGFAAGALAPLIHFAGKAATYVTSEGTPISCTVLFRFFVGALDNREQALIRVSSSEVATPDEGDYVVLSGESERWYVNDVRPKPGFFELRAIRTKARG